MVNVPSGIFDTSVANRNASIPVIVLIFDTKLHHEQNILKDKTNGYLTDRIDYYNLYQNTKTIDSREVKRWVWVPCHISKNGGRGAQHPRVSVRREKNVIIFFIFLRFKSQITEKQSIDYKAVINRGDFCLFFANYWLK